MVKYQTIKPGNIIVSTPHMNKGMIFDKSVILIMSHDKYGTSGIIINKLLNVLKGKEILSSLNLSSTIKNISTTEIDELANLPVCLGGPIDQEKGIILHSNDYKNTTSVKVSSEISISTNLKIISDIITNKGPLHKALILGYSSWTKDQLMSEIRRNDWLILPESPTDAAFQLLFLEDTLYRWNRALNLAGVNTGNYSCNIGNA